MKERLIFHIDFNHIESLPDVVVFTNYRPVRTVCVCVCVCVCVVGGGLRGADTSPFRKLFQIHAIFHKNLSSHP